MNRISNRIKAGSFILSVVMLFWFIGINTVNAAAEYTPLVHKDDYDFTVNSGAIEEWFTVSPDDVVSSVLSVASSYDGTPYSSMDCAQYVAKVLLDAGSISFNNYLACDGNMQVAEFLKLFAGEVPTGIDGKNCCPVYGTTVIYAEGMTSQAINEWCAANCQPADILVFYGEDGNDLHIGIFAGMVNGVAYMWHSGSSHGVCELPVSYLIGSGKAGHTITYLQSFKMKSDAKAYTTLWINKVTGDGTYMGGAVYGVYSDPGLTNELSQLIDDNYNGTLSTPYELAKDGSDFAGTFYIKEKVAPTLLLPDSGDIDLTCGTGSLPDVYDYLDNTVYKVDMRITGVNGSTGTMDYSITRITGAGEELLYSDTVNDYPLAGAVIYVSNDPASKSDMSETLSLELAKTTNTSFDVTSTVFTLKSSGNTVATYSYENGNWGWKNINGDNWGITSFPLKANTSYTIEETFSTPAFTCYDGNKISYQVNNTETGWSKVSDNTYEMSFTTGQLGGAAYSFKAVNDNEEAYVSVVKQVVEASDTKDGFKFELWTQDGSMLLAKGESDTEGKVLWDSGSVSGAEVLTIPAGQYQLRELVPDNKMYGGSKASYTYDVPAGFTVSDDGSYWYKTILAASGTSVAQTVSNDRCQANIKVNKIAEDGNDEGLKFELYYGGNGDEPNWSYELVDTAVTDADGNAYFEELPLGWYRVKEIVPDDYKCVWVGNDASGYKTVHLTKSSDNQTIAVTAINIINTQIVIEKTDAWDGSKVSLYTGSPVKFRVYEDKNANGLLDEDESGAYIEIADTDLDGVLTVKEVGSGAYLLEEMLSPNGYYKAEGLMPVIVDSASKVTVEVPQNPYAEKIIIHKTDSVTGEAVEGAGFTVYEDLNEDGIHQDNEPVAQTYDQSTGMMKEASVTETASGKYESDLLRAGCYVAVETVLPSGYFYCDENGKSSSEANYFAFTVELKDTQADPEQGSQEFYAENVPGGVLVFKVNESGDMLSGAEFTVYKDDACKNTIGVLKEGSTGCYSYYGLDAGTYYLAETKAPTGYICDKNVYEFSVSADESTAVITNAFAAELAQAGDFCDPQPIAGTVLVDTSSEAMMQSKMLSCGKNVELTDYVACAGLNTGETYKLTGTLVVKSTGEKLTDKNGSVIVSETEFTATSSFMTVLVDFEIDTTSLEGESLVAFEILEDQDGNKYSHEDIEDEAQTLTMPEVGTKATDGYTGTSVMLCSDMVTINDEVSCKGLKSGADYKIIGTLMDKATGNALLDAEGKEVSSEMTFTAKSAESVITVKFENVYIPYEVRDIVVFEKLYTDDDVLLAVHENLEDLDQTVTRAVLETNASEETTGKAVMMNSTVTIVDTVDYSGLVPGTNYVIEATLFKSTGESITANGQQVVSMVAFTPEEADGTLEVSITFDTSGLNEGEVVVVFESVKDIATEDEISSGVQTDTVEVSRHADLGSTTQSLTVKALPATGEGINRLAAIGAASALAGGVIALMVMIRNRKEEE